MCIVKGRENVLGPATRSLNEAVAKRSITHTLMILRQLSFTLQTCEGCNARTGWKHTFSLPSLPQSLNEDYWISLLSRAGRGGFVTSPAEVKQEKNRLKRGFGFRREI